MNSSINGRIIRDEGIIQDDEIIQDDDTASYGSCLEILENKT